MKRVTESHNGYRVVSKNQRRKSCQRCRGVIGGQHLAAPTWEAEHALWLAILEQARVNLTPGAACHVGEPGFFRLCYAVLPAETVEAGVRRIVRLLD